MPPKVLKFDAENPSQWDVDHVCNYVLQTDPNLALHIDSIKFQVNLELNKN